MDDVFEFRIVSKVYSILHEISICTMACDETAGRGESLAFSLSTASAAFGRALQVLDGDEGSVDTEEDQLEGAHGCCEQRDHDDGVGGRNLDDNEDEVEGEQAGVCDGPADDSLVAREDDRDGGADTSSKRDEDDADAHGKGQVGTVARQGDPYGSTTEDANAT